MNNYDIVLKGFDFIKELNAQLITLATAILTLSVSLIDKFLDNKNRHVIKTLKISWISYLLSMVFGVWSLMAISGTLIGNCTETNFNIIFPQLLQIICFLTGTSFMIRFGIKILSKK